MAPPPVRTGDRLIVGEEAEEVLRRTHFGYGAEELQPELPPLQPNRYIPVPWEVTPREAKYYTLQALNKAPGEDGVTGRILQAAWSSVGGRVWQVYKASLRLRHYPGALQRAKVVFIPKPGKRDLTNPSSRRPVSLLLVLKKGLERLVARRLAYVVT